MKKLLAFVLAVAMVFCFCACGNNETKTDNTDTQVQSSQTENSSKEETTPKFEVTVKDVDGNIVEGVMVQLCKESCIPARTDANGVAIFNIEITDGYKLSVMSCPDGYEYTGDAEIYLEDGATEYTLEISKK